VEPRLTHACLITANVGRLRDFYARVLGAPPDDDRPEYAEFRTAGGALSMYRHDQLERYAPGATAPARNQSVMIEFEVADVDAEVARLRDARIDWVMPPTTQPWGNRAAYLRDPDGNLVNLYTRVK
jgi:catechol 2,3-dioxygenase-like lactoylglutathione lyase family enzyme